MKNYIEKDWLGLAADARESAREAFVFSINKINAEFGEGYAKEHPELISAFMISSAIVELGTTIAVIQQNQGEKISEKLEELTNVLKST